MMPAAQKIFYLITDLSTGGAQSALLRLLEHQASQLSIRYNPIVACLYSGQGPNRERISRLGIPVYDLGLGGRDQKMAQLAALPRAVLRLYSLLRREKPALLHTWLFHANILGRIVGRAAGVQHIVTSRRSVFMSSPGRDRWLRLTASMDEVVIAVSEAARQEEIKTGGKAPDRVVTIHNSVDLQRFAQALPGSDQDRSTRTKIRQSLGISLDARVIGVVGRLHSDKGSDLLPQIFAQIHKLSPLSHMLVVGEGPLRGALQASLQDAEVASAVTFTGEQPAEKIPELLRAMDMLLLPSRSEGLPNVVLESMAASLPVVASNVGGVPDLVIHDETGYLIDLDETRTYSASLAAASARLLEDPDMRRRMGQAGYNRVREFFSLERSHNQTLQLYEELLNPLPSKPISVLHPITRLIVGGAQENTMYTAGLLDRQRFQAEILSGPQTGSEGSLIEEVHQRDIPLTILPELLRQLSPLNDLAALWKIYRFLRQRRFIIVHTHSSKAGILGRIAAVLAGTPVIIHTVHGWSFHDHMPAATRVLYILLERLCARFTHRLIAVAQKDIEKGLRAGIGRPAQYTLIRSAIPLDEFDPAQADRLSARRELGLPADAPVLGNVGRFSAQKNPLDWVRVAGKVGRALPECRFLLVGDGPLRPQVEQALIEEGIADRTVLAGLRRDVARCLSAIDVFLLTSLWEGLPRVIPQAMRMGLPVVANQVDGSAEAVQPGVSGYLCQPAALDEMAARCIELLQQPDLRRQMGAQGQAFARQEFDLAVMVSQIEKVYTEALEKRRAGA